MADNVRFIDHGGFEVPSYTVRAGQRIERTEWSNSGGLVIHLSRPSGESPGFGHTHSNPECYACAVDDQDERLRRLIDERVTAALIRVECERARYRASD